MPLARQRLPPAPAAAPTFTAPLAAGRRTAQARNQAAGASRAVHVYLHGRRRGKRPMHVHLHAEEAPDNVHLHMAPGGSFGGVHVHVHEVRLLKVEGPGHITFTLTLGGQGLVWIQGHPRPRA